MKKEVKQFKEIKKPNGFLITGLIFLLLVFGIILIYLIFFDKPKIREDTRDYEMEEGFREIINREVDNFKINGTIFFIDNIIVNDLSDGSKNVTVTLFCEWEKNSKTEFLIFQNIADRILEKYPRIFSENARDNSKTNIECKYR